MKIARVNPWGIYVRPNGKPGTFDYGNCVDNPSRIADDLPIAEVAMEIHTMRDSTIFRSARFFDGQTRWTVRLHEGGIVSIRENGREVYRSGGFRCSPLHAEDSDESVAAAVSLACHDATHDESDARIDCAWDASGLSDQAAMRFDFA